MMSVIVKMARYDHDLDSDVDCRCRHRRRYGGGGWVGVDLDANVDTCECRLKCWCGCMIVVFQVGDVFLVVLHVLSDFCISFLLVLVCCLLVLVVVCRVLVGGWWLVAGGWWLSVVVVVVVVVVVAVAAVIRCLLQSATSMLSMLSKFVGFPIPARAEPAKHSGWRSYFQRAPIEYGSKVPSCRSGIICLEPRHQPSGQQHEGAWECGCGCDLGPESFVFHHKLFDARTAV